MDELIEKIAENEGHSVETTSFLHPRFVEIHPFSDGNCRVARLLMNLYLIARYYPPVVLKNEERGQYYKSLKTADAGNLTPFANFIVKTVNENLTLHISIYGGIDELLPLKALASGDSLLSEISQLVDQTGAFGCGKNWTNMV